MSNMDLYTEYITAKLPDGWVPYHQWPEYAEDLDMPPFFRPTKVGTDPVGTRRGVWPLCIEAYASDADPVLAPDASAPNRIIMWQRVTRLDVPRGWHQLSKRPDALRGFVELRSGVDYAQSWSRKAKYERLKWRKLCEDGTYRVEEVSWDEFAALYGRSTVRKQVGSYLIHMFERKWRAHPEHISMWGARNLSTGELVAGLGVINSPTCRGSLYAVGCKVASDESPAMVGLFDHWFEVSLANRVRFLQLGHFWIPGKPKSWKGFSTFKLKFKPTLVLHPPALYRFQCGRLFG